MSCAACASAIATAVQGVDPTAQVQADPKTKFVTVETRANDAAVKTAIATAGYPVSS